MAEAKQATMAKVNDFDIICPHCQEYNSGWIGDPRDNTTEEYECNSCGGLFTIHPDLDFEFL